MSPFFLRPGGVRQPMYQNFQGQGVKCESSRVIKCGNNSLNNSAEDCSIPLKFDADFDQQTTNVPQMSKVSVKVTS